MHQVMMVVSYVGDSNKRFKCDQVQLLTDNFKSPKDMDPSEEGILDYEGGWDFAQQMKHLQSVLQKQAKDIEELQKQAKDIEELRKDSASQAKYIEELRHKDQVRSRREATALEQSAFAQLTKIWYKKEGRSVESQLTTTLHKVVPMAFQSMIKTRFEYSVRQGIEDHDESKDSRLLLWCHSALERHENEFFCPNDYIMGVRIIMARNEFQHPTMEALKAFVENSKKDDLVSDCAKIKSVVQVMGDSLGL